MMKMEDKIYFVDTNILLTATDELRKGYPDVNLVLKKAHEGFLHLYLSGQVLREYMVVATRPRSLNGYGLSSDEALGNVALFRRLCSFCDETEDSHKKLKDIIEQHQLKGKRVHDANIAAVMYTNNIKKILTYNTSDFIKISNINPVEPQGIT